MDAQSTFNIVWVALITVGVGVEVWALGNGKPGDTLSERTRAWFRVHTRPGCVLFGAVWVAFSVWFLFHILG